MDRISSTYCQSALNANHSGTFIGSDFNAKEKDYESGFHYYGTRYYDSEVLTGWLSVDPMADKYPYVSPYNYCEWNPIILKDEDGKGPVFGLVLGAVVDYAGQVADNLVEGKSLGTSMTDINIGTIVVSAAEGALTSGGSTIKKIAVKTAAISTRSVIKCDGSVESFYDQAAQEVIGELVAGGVKVKGPKAKTMTNTQAVAKTKAKGPVTCKQASQINKSNQARNESNKSKAAKFNARAQQIAQAESKATTQVGEKHVKHNTVVGN